MSGTTGDLWSHIFELTKRMKVVFVVLIVATMAMLVLPGPDFLQNPGNYQPFISIVLKSMRETFLPADIKIISLGIVDPLELYVYASFLFGFIIAFPIIAYEVYKFVDPALYDHERKGIFYFLAYISILFVSGVLFGYFIIFPFFVWSMLPFYTAVGSELMFTLMDFYSTLLLSVVSTGLVFTLPAFFVLLVKFGVLKTEVFRKNRKYMYVALVALALFISPGASPQANILLFIPLVILFESGLLFARRYEKKGPPAKQGSLG